MLKNYIGPICIGMNVFVPSNNCVILGKRTNGFHISSDYVYVETAPVYPYQIRRIEELTKVLFCDEPFTCETGSLRPDH